MKIKLKYLYPSTKHLSSNQRDYLRHIMQIHDDNKHNPTIYEVCGVSELRELLEERGPSKNSDQKF